MTLTQHCHVLVACEINDRDLVRYRPSGCGFGLKRRYYFYQRTTDKDTDMAAKYYERATQLDPSYALAWVGLSRVRNWQANAGLIPVEEGHRLAREALARALALNPNLAEAHVQMGRIKAQVDFAWAGADASFQRAIALGPADPENVRAAAASAGFLGRSEELEVPIAGVFALDDVREEYRQLELRHTRGTLVLRP